MNQSYCLSCEMHKEKNGLGLKGQARLRQNDSPLSMAQILSAKAEAAWLELVDAAYDACDDVDSGNPSFYLTSQYSQCLAEYHQAMEENDRDLFWDKKCSKNPSMVECRIYDC